jgi:hypothetical protein
MYTVGDIIWVVSTSRPSVKPYQVVEEIIHKTLKGTVKSFNVKPPGDNLGVIAIDDLDGDIFIDAEAVKEELNKRASGAIEKMIDIGNNMINKYFIYAEDDTTSVEDCFTQKLDEEENYVVLPDGTKAKINIKGDIL